MPPSLLSLPAPLLLPCLSCSTQELRTRLNNFAMLCSAAQRPLQPPHLPPQQTARPHHLRKGHSHRRRHHCCPLATWCSALRLACWLSTAHTASASGINASRVTTTLFFTLSLSLVDCLQFTCFIFFVLSFVFSSYFLSLFIFLFFKDYRVRNIAVSRACIR